MKIILSRKGFDKCSGGSPSPYIVDEGRLFSLPIPSKNNYYSYKDLKFSNELSCYDLMEKVLDNEERMQFCSMSAGKAKSRGRKGQLREDWEDIKLELMYGIVKAKFEQNPYIAGRLLETDGLVLIEGNTWGDTFWGVNSKNGEGENHLGKILMRVREELKKQTLTLLE